MKPVRVIAKVICTDCRGDGVLYGGKQTCMRCAGQGYSRSLVELDQQTLEAISDGLMKAHGINTLADPSTEGEW